jgi:hypothetical protein
LTAFVAALTIASGDLAATPLSVPLLLEDPPHPAIPPASATANTANVELRVFNGARANATGGAYRRRRTPEGRC